MLDVVWVSIAFAFGLGARLVGLPPMTGYLLAGFVLFWAGVDAGETLAHFSEMGVTLLLFSIGLKLRLGTLLKPHVWGVASLHMGLVVLGWGLVFGLIVLDLYLDRQPPRPVVDRLVSGLADGNVGPTKVAISQFGYLVKWQQSDGTRLAAEDVQAIFEAALAKVPLVVSFASIRDETSELAHLILPDHHALAITVIVIATRFDLDVLANHVETGRLKVFDVE